MGMLLDAAKELRIDLTKYKVSKGGKLLPVETRTLGVSRGRIPLALQGPGKFKYGSNSNAHKAGGGESGSQGNGMKADGN